MDASEKPKYEHELLQNYMTMAPEDVQAAWGIHLQSYKGLVAEVARLVNKVAELREYLESRIS